MRPAALPLVLLSLLALARASCAEPGDADGFHPPHGAAGDLVYVQGSDLGTRPTVSFSGRPATILRATKEALLCRVPESLPEGEALVTVGGSGSPSASSSSRRDAPSSTG